MRKKVLIVIALGAAILALMSNNFNDGDIVVMNRDQFESQLEFQSARDFRSLDKVVKFNNYILVVEHNSGVHIIDLNGYGIPHKVGFLQVPGCQDVAIKGKYLYVRSAVDLVIIDLTNSKEISRVREMFESDYDTEDVVLPENSVVLQAN